MRKELREYIEKHHQICDELRKKGYTIQGCNNNFTKCYFSEGKEPFQKIVKKILGATRGNFLLQITFLCYKIRL